MLNLNLNVKFKSKRKNPLKKEGPGICAHLNILTKSTIFSKLQIAALSKLMVKPKRRTENAAVSPSHVEIPVCVVVCLPGVAG